MTVMNVMNAMNAMKENEAPFEISSASMHRILRVGSCPVLEVRITYPRLTATEEGSIPALQRFNETYRRVAEGMMIWAEGAPATRVEEAFLAEGEGAAYRFPRRVLTCTVSAVCDAEGDGARALRVTRVLSFRRGRGEERVLLEDVDVWRLSSLTLREKNRKSVLFFMRQK